MLKAKSPVETIRQNLYMLRLPLAIVLSGVVLAIVQYVLLAEHQRDEIASEFQTIADRLPEQIAERMKVYEYGLISARGAVVAAGGVQGITRSKFHEFSETLNFKDNFEGARGYAFVRRVPRENESEFLKAARTEDRPQFSIRELGAHGGDRFVVQYIEPESANAAAIGLDIASEGSRRQAIESAIATNRATLTAPIRLVQQTDAVSFGFLFMLPTYLDAASLKSAGQRQSAASGLVDTVVSATEIGRAHV